MYKQLIYLPVILFFLVPACKPDAKTNVTLTYTNPVIQQTGLADPCVIFHKGTYYLYPTSGGSNYFVYTSPDLVKWTFKDVVFESGESNTWAPDVFYNKADNTFYLYFSANHKIGVAAADSPTGPFKRHSVLIHKAIDAHMFQDDNGKYYLYYVKWATNNTQFPFRIWVQPMASPTKMSGKPKMLIQPTEAWEKKNLAITEGPFMLKHNNVYYLIYSGSSAATSDYATGYATAKSPTGPFTKYTNNPVVKKGNNALGPGHGCVITDTKGRLWHVYHQQKDDTSLWNRFICIDPVWFDEKGTLHSKATRGIPQKIDQQ